MSGLEATFTLPPQVIEAIAQRAAAIMAETAAEHRSPWLTVEEAADYLRWPKQRLYKLTAARHGIPHRRHRNRLLFHREELDDWLDRHREGQLPHPRPPLRAA